MSTFAVVGCGGFGREVMHIAEEMFAWEPTNRIVFVDDVVPGITKYPVVSFQEWATSHDPRYCVAVGDPSLRRKLVARCEQLGGRPFSLIADTSRGFDRNTTGAGLIMCDYSIATTDATIGQHCQLNIHSYVAHDCVVGDYVTIGPNSHVCGHVIVEDDVYIGAGVSIRNGTAQKPLRIGKGAYVGLGACVVSDVPDGGVWVGNPAKPI